MLYTGWHHSAAVSIAIRIVHKFVHHLGMEPCNMLCVIAFYSYSLVETP